MSKNERFYKNMKTFELFLRVNEYDSDALRDDIINITNSNILNYLNNKEIIWLIKDIISNSKSMSQYIHVCCLIVLNKCKNKHKYQFIHQVLVLDIYFIIGNIIIISINNMKMNNWIGI